jgi:phosphatidylglycerol:prolipoprotein diacylglycerol transferase
MLPDLTVGVVSINTHDLFMGLALVIGLAVFRAESRHQGVHDERIWVMVAGIVAGGAIGGRLSGVLQAWVNEDGTPLYLVWAFGGRSIIGGLMGAYIGALIAKRLVGYPHRTGNVFAPAVAIGLAVGRIGCFLTEAPGRPTSVPWAVHINPVAAASIPDCPGCVAGQGMHPSFLYEVVFLVGVFLVLRFWARDRVSVPGELFPLFLACYATFRFLVEFTRANPVVVAGLTWSQIVILILSPLIVRHLVTQARRGTYALLVPRWSAAAVPERSTP